jgi:hypothetical protein
MFLNIHVYAHTLWIHVYFLKYEKLEFLTVTKASYNSNQNIGFKVYDKPKLVKLYIYTKTKLMRITFILKYILSKHKYLIVFNLCMNLFLCRCMWNLGSNEELGSNCSRSTRPSSGRMVSDHIRHTLSLHDVINMFATDPLINTKVKIHFSNSSKSGRTVTFCNNTQCQKSNKLIIVNQFTIWTISIQM